MMNRRKLLLGSAVALAGAALANLSHAVEPVRERMVGITAYGLDGFKYTLTLPDASIVQSLVLTKDENQQLGNMMSFLLGMPAKDAESRAELERIASNFIDLNATGVIQVVEVNRCRIGEPAWVEMDHSYTPYTTA